MNEKINDGGPAHPVPVTVGPNGDLYPAYIGMSLRDWLAGHALAGMEAWVPDNPCLYEPDGSRISPTDERWHGAVQRSKAEYAYGQADAMLAEREKGGES